MYAALLSDRGVIKLSGEDAKTFLNGLITTDTSSLEPGAARFGALLTPQGKILFDFFVIATGRSDTHVSAIGDHLVDELKKEGVRPSGVEGMRGGRWVLADYVDFVVHIFHPAAREFYQLERLWGDAPVRVFEPQETA